MYYRNRKTAKSEIRVVGDFGARITWLCLSKQKGELPWSHSSNRRFDISLMNF